jgi:hypothetical protein
MTTTPKRTPNRRWFRYSLRTLFVVVTVFACVIGFGIREAVRRHDEDLDRQQIKRAMKDAWLRNDPGEPDY